ncbi:MAG: sulfotransferase domain-containing protein [Candidatus Eremiobacteraeota bacterium]|nr:sulfotransferase domain-containing protein [Candidatus Eremiobacteraeota bacterium]
MKKLSIFDDHSLSARLRRRYNAIFDALYIDVNRDYRASCLLAGSGRSGTTWAAELLNFDNFYRYVSEPFNRGHVSLCKNFALRQYLRPDDDAPAFLEPARAIFSGRVRNDWTDSQNRRKVCTHRLIKDVRTTLMLKWIRNHFSGMPIAFMVRHPFAVAHSRVKLGWNTNLREMFLSQPELMQDFLTPFREAIKGAESAFLTHVFDWCVENYVPLIQLDHRDVHMVFYERLCTEPRTELAGLCAHFDRPFDALALDAMNKPSSTTRPGRAHKQRLASTQELVEGWRAHVELDEIQRAVEILHMFGLDEIYDGESMPKVENALGILKPVSPRPSERFLRIAAG